MSWNHIAESALGTGAALLLFTLGRKALAAVAIRAINAAMAQRRRLR